jgi:hypothetical protein
MTRKKMTMPLWMRLTLTASIGWTLTTEAASTSKLQIHVSQVTQASFAPVDRQDLSGIVGYIFGFYDV